MPNNFVGKRLAKLAAQVTFSPHERATLQLGSTTYLFSLSVTPQDEWRWHNLPEGKPNDSLRSEWKKTDRPLSPPPRLAKHQGPVVIELKPGATPVRKRQYPLPLEV